MANLLGLGRTFLARPSSLLTLLLWVFGVAFSLLKTNELRNQATQNLGELAGSISYVLLMVSLAGVVHQGSVYFTLHWIEGDPARWNKLFPAWIGSTSEVTLRFVILFLLLTAGGEIPLLVQAAANWNQAAPTWTLPPEVFPLSAFALFVVLTFWDIGAASSHPEGFRHAMKEIFGGRQNTRLTFLLGDAFAAYFWGVTALWVNGQTVLPEVLTSIIVFAILYVVVIGFRVATRSI